MRYCMYIQGRKQADRTKHGADWHSLSSQLRLDLRSFAFRKVLLDRHLRFLNHARVLDRRRHIDLLVELPLDRVLQQLLQHPPQRLPRPRARDNPRRRNEAAQRRDAAN